MKPEEIRQRLKLDSLKAERARIEEETAKKLKSLDAAEALVGLLDDEVLDGLADILSSKMAERARKGSTFPDSLLDGDGKEAPQTYFRTVRGERREVKIGVGRGVYRRLVKRVLPQLPSTFTFHDVMNRLKACGLTDKYEIVPHNLGGDHVEDGPGRGQPHHDTQGRREAGHHLFPDACGEEVTRPPLFS